MCAKQSHPTGGHQSKYTTIMHVITGAAAAVSTCFIHIKARIKHHSLGLNYTI